MDLGLRIKAHLILVTIVILILFQDCTREYLGTYDLKVPVTFDSLPIIPSQNPMNRYSIQLGELLFNDTRLSADGTVSCASCHLKDYAYSDTVPISSGIHGRRDKRNAYGLINVAYQKRLFMEGGVPNLELQALAPLLNDKEMGFDLEMATNRIEDDVTYKKLARSAYGKSDVDVKVISYALAAFQRSLISSGSDYDRYLAGDSLAMTTDQVKGMDLFFSDRTGCGSCHSGFLLTDQDYYNIGLDSNSTDAGRANFTLDAGDTGKFKTPSLRNVAKTWPYMHDGRLATLYDVVNHYNKGGEDAQNKDHRVRALNLSDREMEQLVVFMEALSDD